MSLRSWAPGRWSIAVRVLSISVAPVLAMFLAVIATLYSGEEQQAADSVQQNGQLLAKVLAESSPYGVLSRNVDGLQRSTERLLDAQEGVEAIEILDEARRPLARSGVNKPGRFVFEEPVTADTLDIDLFDTGAPHINNARGTRSAVAPGPVVGFIRIVMSPEPILSHQRHRAFVSIGLMFAVCAVVVGLVLYFAKALIRSPLNDVMCALRSIRQGDLDIVFGRRAGGELGELQDVIEEMSRGLKVRRDELRRLVDQRTEELRLQVERATESDAERRRLVAHTVDLIERERRRISRELHDQFNASLLSVRLRAEALAIDDGRPLDAAEVVATANAITREVERIYGDARRMIKSLRPEVLDSVGLAGALAEAVRTFNADRSGCDVDLDVPPLDKPLPKLSDEASIAAFRLVQEALSNIRKHAGAARARIVVHFDARSGDVILEVEDNGVGFDPSLRSAGFGLLGMRERLASVGGLLDVRSTPGQGTQVRARFPVKPRGGQSTHTNASI
jgi:two-component system, NarL family, sensor histidine kinase UhpB